MKGPFHMSFLSPHLPQFQQSAGATPLWSLWIGPSARPKAATKLDFNSFEKYENWLSRKWPIFLTPLSKMSLKISYPGSKLFQNKANVAKKANSL
jgi:hypothetical protein